MVALGIEKTQSDIRYLELFNATFVLTVVADFQINKRKLRAAEDASQTHGALAKVVASDTRERADNSTQAVSSQLLSFFSSKLKFVHRGTCHYTKNITIILFLKIRMIWC